jgi:hypothetical protein
MSGGPAPLITHIKRHATAGPYPNERRPQQQQQHEHPPNNDSNNNNNNNNNNNSNNNHNHNNTNNGYNNRGWKRPCMFLTFFVILINIQFLSYK